MTLRAAVGGVFVHEAVARWIVDLVRATRELDIVAIGSSVRGTLALNRAARAWAVLHQRRYVDAGGRRAAVRARARAPHPLPAELPRRDPRPRLGGGEPRGARALPRAGAEAGLRHRPRRPGERATA